MDSSGSPEKNAAEVLSFFLDKRRKKHKLCHEADVITWKKRLAKTKKALLISKTL
jgi:hypothetical protein